LVYQRHSRSIFCMVMILLLFFVSTGDCAVGVQPLVIPLQLKPGETGSFQFKLSALDNIPEQVEFAIYQPFQQPDGSLSFIIPENFQVNQWIRLDTTRVLLKPGEEFTVRGTVKIPLNAKGSHLAAVMVEPKNFQANDAMQLGVRYAVLLNIKIDAPGLRPTAKVNAFELIRNANGEPLVYAVVQNNSLLDYYTSAFITIRDNKTKRLIERVELRPEVGWLNSKSEMHMLPGSILQYYGTPNQVLTPGEYELRLFYQYGSSGQILLSKTIQVKSGDFYYQENKLKRVSVSTDYLTFNGRPGTSMLKSFSVENKWNQPLRVLLEPTEIEPNYPFSVLKFVNLEFKPGKEVILEPRRMTTIIVKANFPKDSVVQGNYGILKVKVFSMGPNPMLLEESMLNLEAVVTGTYKTEAEAVGISAARDGSNYLVSVIVKNKGNIKIAPQADVVIKGENGKTLGMVKVNGTGEKEQAVVPFKTMTLMGYAEGFKPGKYQAEIRIYHGSNEIGVSRLTMELK